MDTDDEKLATADAGQRVDPNKDQFSDGNPKQVASYVCDLTGELKKIAKEADLKFLAYLLEMAHIEAFKIMTENQPVQQNQKT